ncbi:MAG: Crp/Fnr family transcriptional regulator [Clostridiales bacterium]|jgi:CRP/FNR family transcriptional regulator|nr:Crp/Fnr family transcriptional regulator [Clostridiales bacterium]
MTLGEYFPIWNKLSESDRDELERTAQFRSIKKGTVIHRGSEDCVGLFVIKSGQLRAYILSEEGKEVTVYRLFERDICLFSASCIIASIQFDLIIETEKDAELWVIPADIYKSLMLRSVDAANYTNQIIASRMSDVVWLVEQVMWKSFDKRLAEFLLEESAIEQSDQLQITHDRIASHLGTAREVVTRMLRYFQSEGAVTLSRGSINLTGKEKLAQIAQ